MTTKKKKAIVIGAGILGLAHAKFLAENQFDVDVFERSEKASGSSIRNFGMVWPIGQHSDDLLSIAMRTKEVWEDICQSANIWYSPTGSFQLLQTELEMKLAQEFFEAESKHRPGLKILNKNEIAESIPQINKQRVNGAIYSDSEVIVESREAIRQIPNYLSQTLGINFHFGCPVIECHPGWIKDSFQKKHEAEVIIVANGYETKLLFPDYFKQGPFTISQLNMFRSNAIETTLPPICGGLSFLHYPSYAVSASLKEYENFCKEEYPKQIMNGIHLLISQNQHQQLTIGDSHQYGVHHEPFQENAVNQYILDYLDELLNLNLTIAQHWTGEYLKLTNGKSYLFEEIMPSIYVANGTGGAGMTLSWGIAERNLRNII